MTVDEFMAKYYSAGIDRYGGLYFDQATALEVMAAAHLDGLQIVLIDAFFLTETSTQPSMADSVDFDTYGVPDGSDRDEFARRLVGDPARANMYFELTFWPIDKEERCSQ